jgi:hypothetical protein
MDILMTPSGPSTERSLMTSRRVFRWLGWTLLYTLTLWGLWSVAALLAAGAHDPTTTRWVWITAVLTPLALALIGALATGTSWWTVIPPLVIGLSLLALTVATWLSPAFGQEPGAATVLTLLGAGAERTVVLLLSLTVLAPPLAYGLAWVGLRMSQSMEDPERSVLRGFARWLLISVPLITLGLATGNGVAVVLGAIALFVAGRHVGWDVELWRYFR